MGGGGICFTASTPNRSGTQGKFSKPHLVNKRVFLAELKEHNLRFLRILIFISMAQNFGKIINENKILLVFYIEILKSYYLKYLTLFCKTYLFK